MRLPYWKVCAKHQPHMADAAKKHWYREYARAFRATRLEEDAGKAFRKFCQSSCKKVLCPQFYAMNHNKAIRKDYKMTTEEQNRIVQTLDQGSDKYYVYALCKSDLTDGKGNRM